MGIKRFVLVYEPLDFNKKHNVINFSKDNPYSCTIKTVEYFKGISTCKTGKSLLSDIDDYTISNFHSKRDFLECIGIRNDIKDLFIGFSTKGWINKLPVLFYNPEVEKKLNLVKDDRVNDSNGINEMIDMLLEDDSFYKMFIESNMYKTVFLQSAILQLKSINEQKKSSIIDIESSHWYDYQIERVREELKKYHIYRGMILLRQKFNESENKIVTFEKQPENSYIKPEDSGEFEQLIIPGFSEIKRKNRTIL